MQAPTDYGAWEQTDDRAGAWLFAKHYSANTNPEWVASVHKGEISDCVVITAYYNGTGPDDADADVDTLHLCDFNAFVDAMIELRDIRKQRLRDLT